MAAEVLENGTHRAGVAPEEDALRSQKATSESGQGESTRPRISARGSRMNPKYGKDCFIIVKHAAAGVLMACAWCQHAARSPVRPRR